MRVATYTDASAPSQGSLFALAILLSTMFLGTGVVPTVAEYAGGILPRLVTPLWLALYLGAFLGLMFTHGINWISWLIRYRLLLVLLLIGTIMSVSWSIDAQVSAERVVHLVGSSLIAIYIGFSIPLLVTLRIFSVVLGLILIASAAAALGLPALGIENYEGSQVWRGVFNSKNDLGFWAGAGVLLYITLSESAHSNTVRLLCFLMAGVSLAVLAMSQSATSFVAMLVAGSLALYLYIASRFQLGFIRMAFIAVLFIALTGLAIANIETSELVGRSGDLTGRGEVWRQVIKLIVQHPLTGVGYGSLWFPTDNTIWIQQSFFDFTWVVYHAHNGLLQVASEVGMPLAVIALLMVAQQLIEIFYCQYERQQVGVLFVLGFVTAFLVSNFSEARFLVTRELFWIFFLALPISMLRQINLVREDSDDAEHPSSSAQPTTTAYAGVPGKPWLGPLPAQLTQSSTPSQLRLPSGGAAAVGEHAAERLLEQRRAEDSQRAISDEEIADIKSMTLSLTETDIDLGEILDDTPVMLDSGAASDATSEGEVTSDEPRDGEVVSAEQIADKQAPNSADARKPETFDNDDTFDVDRYDINFDDSGDWIDIDLDESK